MRKLLSSMAMSLLFIELFVIILTFIRTAVATIYFAEGWENGFNHGPDEVSGESGVNWTSWIENSPPI
jgi:hypothetical protein